MVRNKFKIEENKDDEEKKYNISFTKKRTKSNIRFGAKLLIYLVIAALSGAAFSSFIIT